MFEVVVLSGKGGTGKTSVTASLAILAGDEAVVADCDVDSANMHLLLCPDFGKASDFYGGELAVINQALCKQCGRCAEVCRFHAIPFIKDQYSISELDCEGCGYCEKVCPTNAITMVDRKSGTLFVSKTRTGNRLVHARLDIGAENSGKLVARVKHEAKLIAASESKPYIIVDGAPGIGCPVISSLSGANYVVLVTEPTMSGLHDLERISELIKKFRIQTGCIINKYDLNPDKTKEIGDYLHNNRIDHLADIPYDGGFTEAMVEGKTIVETESSLIYLMIDIWEKIKTKSDTLKIIK
jgi:MinD superfamily P-loop ATPase